ncbi:MAG: mechanosensitive ion channel family protein [Actinomycetia bacterium]|nr:mechanosensitive ion channel family protein [Actinomycetes bacterium]
MTSACGEEPRRLCRWVFEQTDSEAWAGLAEWVVDRPLRVGLILATAFIIIRVLRRSVTRFGDQAAARSERERVQLERGRERGASVEVINGRAEQRAKTVTSVLVSLVTAVVWTVAGLMILGQLGISLAPVLAGAGVLGIMLGFGAQSVVADFLAGIFMLLEDQFGVGDVIDVGEVTGGVEKVSLRVTTIRDVNGTVWHVPNSEIRRVGNLSQLWSRAVLDIDVAYETDLRRAEGVIQRVADDLWHDSDFTSGDILEPPEVWGVQNLGADGIALRLVVKTDPAEQWVIARELRLRIKEAFDEAGIEIPFPQRTVWLRQENPTTEACDQTVEVSPVRDPTISDELMGSGGGS